MPDLIVYTDVHTLTNLNDQVEERKLKSGIAAAHIELEKVLGRTGYALVYANAPSFTSLSPNTAYYLELQTRAKLFLAWKARQRSTIALAMEADRGGMFKRQGETFQSLGSSDLKAVDSDAESYASVYLERLIDYLCENKTVFTWYTTNVEGEERIDKTNTKNVGGISFRRANGQETYRG